MMGIKMRQKHSWEITDELWSAAEPLIPQKERDKTKTYERKVGGGRPPTDARMVFAQVL
jgi:hypothetical protein